jgi:anti-sigma B factor antagonist
MEITAHDADAGVTILRLAGRLNMVTAPQLRSSVADAVAAGRSRLVIDLAQTESMDSSGLGVLINSLKVARQAGGDLRIAAPNEQVQLVLQLTNMKRLFHAHPSAEVAYQND